MKKGQKIRSRKTWRAACMTPDEYELWRQGNTIIRVEGERRYHRPCDDCPAAFAAEMRLEGRCNGSPMDRRAPAVTRSDRRSPREEEEASLLRCYQPGDVVDLRLGRDSEAFRRAS